MAFVCRPALVSDQTGLGMAVELLCLFDVLGHLFNTPIARLCATCHWCNTRDDDPHRSKVS